METFCANGIITALSSISHNGGQSFGTTAKLRREKFVQPDGSVEDVPVISGNGIRGRLRDLGMQHMCQALGYGLDGTGLTLSAFHFLFSGGSLTSIGGKALHVDQAKRIRTIIPLVGVFGGAMGNAILPGILKCGKAIPICLETRHLLPDAVSGTATNSIWDYLQEEMYTRRDDSKNDRLRAVLDEPTRLLLAADDSAKAAKATDEPVGATGQSQQMMYRTEVFAAGTRFHWRVVLDDPTDTEMGAFLACLAQFAKMPYIGGKSNIGIGEVSVNLSNWLRLDSRNIGGESITTPVGSQYQRHLTERSTEIKQLLEGM